MVDVNCPFECSHLAAELKNRVFAQPSTLCRLLLSDE